MWIFFWAPIVYIFPFDLPRWINDYLTLNALAGASILWAFHNTAQNLGFDRLGSVFSVIRTYLFNLHLCGNSFENFRNKAVAVMREGHEEDGMASKISQISRTEMGYWVIFESISFSLILIVTSVLAPYIVPFLMSVQDRRNLEQSAQAFKRRCLEIQSLFENEILADRLKSILSKYASDFANWGDINQLFYSEIRKNIYYYYLAILSCFIVVVFLNYIILRFQGNIA